ncbi:MAG: 50S ribosomal protein L9 [Bacteroidales bacterium]|jgi:large subunit ribosomal protein L9|nr:50S ribosomal protein L9 [Bacteroidales bacterium]
MELILKQDIENLGNKDEIVVVKPGYGRNYLIPQGFATLATASAKKVHAENMKQKAYKEAKLIADAEKLAAKLQTSKIKISAKTSSTGKIFGSVNTIMIAESLEKQGYSIERKNITIKGFDTIKEIGNYSANIKLYKNIKVNIDFEVIPEE